MITRHKKVILFLLSVTSILLLLFPFFQKNISVLQNPADLHSDFSFSHENGFYDSDITVTMEFSKARFTKYLIRYTTDGSTPSAASECYAAPLLFQVGEVPKVITVKAGIFDKNDVLLAGPYTATYCIGKNISNWSNALVVSITSDSEGLFSPETGILHPMQDCGPTEDDWSWFKQQNCKQRSPEWIRPAHMDMFEPDGTNIISQDIGLCVDGDHGSMTHYPYSLKVLAGSEYDKLHPSFHYDIFHYYNTKGTAFPHIQDYTNMVFRNGGNEYNAGVKDPEQKGTMLRWNIGSRLADEAGYFVAASRPAMIFLNGELYSVAQLQDTYNRFNTASKLQLSKDHIQIFKGPERLCTKLGKYEDLYYSYPEVDQSPIVNSNNQQQLEQMVSLQDMFDYYTFEVLVNNTDYPKKNYAIWKYDGAYDASVPFSDGKYRFFINDLDCTYDFRYDDDLWTAYFKKIKEDGVVMGSMVLVEQYKAQFLNSLCDRINSGLFYPEHLDQVINEANNDFNLIASYYYTSEDEAQRQRNVQLLKDNAFERTNVLRSYIQETFAPQLPYTLSVKAPMPGCSISLTCLQLTASDGDFSGLYYGDYPMELSYSSNSSYQFDHWNVNGKSVNTPKLNLDATLIQDGKIEVELVMQHSEEKLLISEVCANPQGAWIELYNSSDSNLDLSTYKLSNNSPALFSFRLPEQILAPGEIFVAGIDNTGFFRIEQGKNIYLTKSGTTIDSTTIPVMAETESYGRFGETDEWRYFANPTPAVMN